MARRKAPITKERCLKANEEMLRKKAAEIMQAKQIGLSQTVINMMVYEFTLRKQLYDTFRGRMSNGE